MVVLTRMVPHDGPAVVDFLTSSTFPFHGIVSHTRESAQRSVDSGRFSCDDSQGYWIDDDDGRHGVVVVEDLQDDTPMFDLRLAEGSRGRGIGTATLTALADLVFASPQQPRRLEGQTREDNLVMRRAFLSARFVQESFYRQGWPAGDGFVGAVAYAMLRDDWQAGTTTPIGWD
ncbi:GNAT family N-acetyltransferase [Vibrio cholerae]|nr:GNAT family N-acetyltransferase [Vibrio cholerae]